MRTLAFAFLSMLFAACVSYPQTDEGGVDQNLITQQEILDSGVTNLYDAVMRLRPRWIRPNTLVYMDGISLGDTNALRDWPQDTAITMEWLDSMEAVQRLPEVEGNISGVIVVRTRSPQDR